MVKLVFGFSKPKHEICGMVFSGEIVKIGSEVKEFKIGDEVFGSTEDDMKAHSEYLKIKENKAIAKKPQNLNHNQIAAIPFGSGTALRFLEKAELKRG